MKHKYNLEQVKANKGRKLVGSVIIDLIIGRDHVIVLSSRLNKSFSWDMETRSYRNRS